MKTTGKYGALEFSLLFGLLFLATQVLAGDHPTTGAQLSYAGIYDHKPAFRLVLANAKADRFLITVRNTDNEILYSQKTNSKHISTLFQLDSPEFADQNLQVKIQNIATGESDLFNINLETRTVMEAKINKT